MLVELHVTIVDVVSPSNFSSRRPYPVVAVLVLSPTGGPQPSIRLLKGRIDKPCTCMQGGCPASEHAIKQRLSVLNVDDFMNMQGSVMRLWVVD